MKRSEMINKLIQDVVVIREASSTITNKELAANLLKYLEGYGMLPPTRTYEDWAGMGTITETDNTWTPE